MIFTAAEEPTFIEEVHTMHQITSSKDLSELFLTSVPVSLTLRDQFVLILRDGDRATVWKNLQGDMTTECFPGEAAWPEGIPAVTGLTVLMEEKGKGDTLVRSYRLIVRFQLGKEPEQLWLVGDDKVDHETQLFLAYESPKTSTVETVVVVEGCGKRAKSCGALSFNREGKKALNTYVKVVKALMGLSGIRLAAMLDGDIPPQLPEGSCNDTEGR
jgi:hypothetical protein